MLEMMGTVPFSRSSTRATPHGEETTSREWAPGAASVTVTGEISNWSADATLQVRECGGNWPAVLQDHPTSRSPDMAPSHVIAIKR